MELNKCCIAHHDAQRVATESHRDLESGHILVYKSKHTALHALHCIRYTVIIVVSKTDTYIFTLKLNSTN